MSWSAGIPAGKMPALPKHYLNVYTSTSCARSFLERCYQAEGPFVLDTLRYLSVAVGPRPSASPAERHAAEWCRHWLAAHGVEATLQPFPGVASFTWYVAPIYAAGAIAALALLKGCRRLAALLAVPATLAFYREQTYRPAISAIVPKRPSMNVVARVPARRERRHTVVLSAHLDTQHAALSFHPRLVGGFRRSYLLTVAGLLWIACLSLWRLVRPTDRPGRAERLGGLFALNLAAGLGVLAHRHLFLSHVDGANDNGSGVAVVLAAVDAVAGQLEYTDLWVVLTGCEETGSYGMVHFLENHSLDIDSTLFVNCDNCGAGQVTVIEREGPLKSYAADPALIALARKIIHDEDLGAPGGRIGTYHLLGTDVEAALERGYRGISVMAFDDQGRLPHWHWLTDTIEHIEPATLETARRFVTSLIRALDRRHARRRGRV